MTHTISMSEAVARANAVSDRLDEALATHDAEPPAPDAEPDDLVERTRFWVEMCREELSHPTGFTYFLTFKGILSEWLARANLRPTREEAMALAEEKQADLNILLADYSRTQLREVTLRHENTELRAKVAGALALAEEKTRIVEDVPEATCRAMDDAGKIEGRLRERIANLLTENEELRARSSPRDKRLCDAMDEIAELRATIADAALEDDEEVTNPGPGPRVVWSEVMKPFGGFSLQSPNSDASFSIRKMNDFMEIGKRYRVTVTEADDTPEEGKDG